MRPNVHGAGGSVVVEIFAASPLGHSPHPVDQTSILTVIWYQHALTTVGLQEIASFKRPVWAVLSVDVSLCVCLFVCNFDKNISKKRFSCPKWKCLRSVDWWHHYVTWLYDVIIVTSQYSKSSHSETRTRINYPCGICGSYKHTLR